MECENMKQTKTQNASTTTKVSKVKLNVNYVEFIAQVVQKKLIARDTATLSKMYVDAVKVKSAKNINRVADRTQRENVRPTLNDVLKRLGLSYSEFDRTSKAVTEKIRVRRASNYIDIKQ